MLAAHSVVDLVAAAVRTVPAFSAANTTTDRGWPLDEVELPAARVLAGDEEIETQSVHQPRIEVHLLDVDVELRVKATANLDDVMHDATASVLTAVYGTTAVNARLAAGVQSLETARIERRLQSEGQAKAAAVFIQLRARFAAFANAPETIVF